jgi:hypothetical protein
MLYSNEILTIQNLNVKQVNKNVAKKAFLQGKTIFLHSCNMRINNMWQSPMPTNLQSDANVIHEMTFEAICNEFEYYNCDAERGKRILFFAPINNL